MHFSARSLASRKAFAKGLCLIFNAVIYGKRMQWDLKINFNIFALIYLVSINLLSDLEEHGLTSKYLRFISMKNSVRSRTIWTYEWWKIPLVRYHGKVKKLMFQRIVYNIHISSFIVRTSQIFSDQAIFANFGSRFFNWFFFMI